MRFIRLALTLTACASADDTYLDPLDLGELEQGVGIKVSTNDAYGSVVVAGSPHIHARCATSGTSRTCSVPRTKGPTYFIASSLNATEAQRARTAVGLIDQQTNWKFTETTDAAAATLTFNRIDDFCTGDQIQYVVCTNLSGQGNTLTEPTALHNTYTEHTKGVIHLDRAHLNECAACTSGEKSKRMMHGFQAGILTWMGLGLSLPSTTSPGRWIILNPDDTGVLTPGEVCRLNGFLPAAQFGSATSIGLTTTSACVD